MRARVVIRATTLFNLQCNNVARQVVRKCCPYYLTLKGLYEKNIKQLTETETISFRNDGIYLYVKTSCLDLTTLLIPCLFYAWSNTYLLCTCRKVMSFFWLNSEIWGEQALVILSYFLYLKFLWFFNFSLSSSAVQPCEPFRFQGYFTREGICWFYLR